MYYTAQWDYLGDGDNAARRPSGGRAAGWMIGKTR